ncbi:MAG: heavy-metal-associated domain-containing protein [Chloroflexi bacterium]|nr:heavy-metal-associated domain-containing protein [Chloroflexota bacterium]
MKKFTISVPSMYADHHVLRVREALLGLPGVVNVVASSAGRRVTVETNDGVTPQEVGRILTEAGYPLNREPALPQLPENSQDGSSWYMLIHRVTKTDRRDLEMSGDFRRY